MCFKNIFASSQGTLFAVGVEGFNIEQNLQVLKYFALIFQFLFLFLMILSDYAIGDMIFINVVFRYTCNVATNGLDAPNELFNICCIFIA